MAFTEEPILCRLHRLENLLMHLEEIRGGCTRSQRSCSNGSATSSTGEGKASSVDSIHIKSLEKYCHPVEAVLKEVEVKGSLVDRLCKLEEQLLMVCMQLEIDVKEEKSKDYSHKTIESKEELHKSLEAKKHRRGLSRFVNSCIGRNQVEISV